MRAVIPIVTAAVAVLSVLLATGLVMAVSVVLLESGSAAAVMAVLLESGSVVLWFPEFF